LKWCSAIAAVFVGAVAMVVASPAPAQTIGTSAAVPRPVELPSVLTLDESVNILRAKGLDLLIANAQIISSEGDVLVASAIANPNVNAAAGPAFNYNAHVPGCSGCQPYAVQWGISDNGALVDFLAGKRGLRVESARAALASAKLARADALRNLEAQVKQQYVQVALAKRSVDFASEVDHTLDQLVELNRRRYPGVIDEGALARVEVQKLEADQALDSAKLGLRQARVGLAFLLGVRGGVPDFDVEGDVLKFRVPAALAGATEQSLIERSLALRPDLQQLAYERKRADASLRLAQRQRFPDVALQAQYTQLGQGQNVGQPMNLVVGLSVTLPVFYQQQGEIRRAHADVDVQALTQVKTQAQIVSDVGTAYAAYVASKTLVERMETSLLGRAKTARDIVEIQHRAGTVPLMDFLDAERTYIATNVEYFQDLAAYWTAIFQLEQATATELR
jgi:cobalt-zinc-cadmium efflux system outer membrane protein